MGSSDEEEAVKNLSDSTNSYLQGLPAFLEKVKVKHNAVYGLIKGSNV